MTFKALLAAKTDEKISTSVVEMTEQDLMPGDETIAVDFALTPAGAVRHTNVSIPEVTLDRIRSAREA